MLTSPMKPRSPKLRSDTVNVAFTLHGNNAHRSAVPPDAKTAYSLFQPPLPLGSSFYQRDSQFYQTLSLPNYPPPLFST